MVHASVPCESSTSPPVGPCLEEARAELMGIIAVFPDLKTILDTIHVYRDLLACLPPTVPVLCLCLETFLS